MPPEIIHGFVEQMLDFNHRQESAANIEIGYGLNLTVGTGGSHAILNQANGYLRQGLTTAATAGNMAATGLFFEPRSGGGPLILDTRVRTSDADSSSIFFGLTDAVTETNGVVIENEDGTLNTNPTDAFGFLLEGEQDETIQAIGVKGGVDHSLVALTDAEDFVNGEFRHLRLEVLSNGTVRFLVDGANVHEEKDYFTLGTAAAPKAYAAVMSSDGRGTAYNVDWDYLYTCHPRAK